MSREYGRHVRSGAPETTTFDMLRPGIPQNNVLAAVVYGGSVLRCKLHDVQINKHGMEGVKPPYILLSNGKNVSPEELEDRFATVSFVKEGVL